MDKDSVSTPTVATEDLLLIYVIDTMQQRDVATVDISGAFMQSDIEGDNVHVKLEEKMAELFVKLDPKLYRKYIHDKNGRTVMYAKLKKAIYGTLQAAMLFWNKLSGCLEEWGFTINPYDLCVANKIANGE